LQYRFSTDDNIYFLHDLAVNSRKYRSIFDNPYLAFWREMHCRYNNKVHLNIFFEEEGFNLSRMPTCFKSEWRENSDWMRLTFHGKSLIPDNPYLNSPYREVAHDFDMVTSEIIRFAGEELLSPVTTIHWCGITKDGCRALRDRRIEVLSGLYRIQDGKPFAAAYLTTDILKTFTDRLTWYDPELDLVHLKIHAMIEHDLPDEPNTMERFLDGVSANPGHRGLIELLIHEYALTQTSPYFREYARERVISALEWLSSKGYVSVLHGAELAATVRETETKQEKGRENG